MITETQHHQWVKHVITPVHLIDEVVFVDPAEQDTSEGDAVYGCDRCGAPLSASTLGRPCEGES